MRNIERENDNEIMKLSEIMEDLKSLTDRTVEVGIISHAGDPVEGAEGLYEGGELTVGELATIHEFGLGNNPIRSIIQEPLESSEATAIIEKEMAKKTFWKALGTGTKAEQKAFENIGKKLVNHLIKWFKSCGEGSWEDLSDDYLKRKTRAGYSDQPLHTTLQLMEALEYRVKS